MKSLASIFLFFFILTYNISYSQEVITSNKITPQLNTNQDSIHFNTSLLNNESAPSTIQLPSQEQVLINRFAKFNNHYIRTYKKDYSPFGGYELFNNRVFYHSGNFQVNVGFGLVKQNTALNASNPNLHYTIDSQIEYELNPWLSLYLYGQYLSSPFNQKRYSPDPISYMNPFFYNSEIGGGVKAKYKNIKADVGMHSIKDTQFKDEKSLNTMNTKVSIGF